MKHSTKSNRRPSPLSNRTTGGRQIPPPYVHNLFGDAIAEQEQLALRAAVDRALADAGAIDPAVADIFLMHAGDRVRVEDGKVLGLNGNVELFRAARPALFNPPDPARDAKARRDAAYAKAAKAFAAATTDEQRLAARKLFERAKRDADRAAKGKPPELKFDANETAQTLDRKVRDYSQWLREH
jgi:hypothetical protein